MALEEKDATLAQVNKELSDMEGRAASVLAEAAVKVAAAKGEASELQSKLSASAAGAEDHKAKIVKLEKLVEELKLAKEAQAESEYDNALTCFHVTRQSCTASRNCVFVAVPRTHHTCNCCLI